jgi:DNA polymerase III alpha subunit
MKDGNSVRVGGMLGWVSKRITKQSMKYYAKFSLEDLTGKIDGIIFPKSFEKFGGLVEAEAFVLIKGRLKVDELESTEDDGEIRKQAELTADEIWRFNPESGHWIQQKSPHEMSEVDAPLVDMVLEDDVMPPFESVVAESYSGVFVDIIFDLESAQKSSLSSLKNKLSTRKGPTPVRLRFPLQEREVVILTGPENEVVFSQEFSEELKGIPGIKDVRLQYESRVQ